ncbi:MAG: hypothetical protein ACK535_07760 [Cyanobacteriota bacterium]
MPPDIRWQRRCANFCLALDQLETYFPPPALNARERQQGLIKAFEYCFELGWNTLRDLLFPWSIDLFLHHELPDILRQHVAWVGGRLAPRGLFARSRIRWTRSCSSFWTSGAATVQLPSPKPSAAALDEADADPSAYPSTPDALIAAREAAELARSLPSITTQEITASGPATPRWAEVNASRGLCLLPPTRI